MDYIFFDGLLQNQSTFSAPEHVVRHINALRIRDHERIHVLNGKGLLATCTIQHFKSEIQVIVESTEVVSKPPELILVIGLLDKRDRWEFAIEKAGELGVTQIIPLISSHTQRAKLSEERIRSKLIAAITQSGNAWLPVLRETMRIDEAVKLLRSVQRVIVGDMNGTAPTAGVLDLDLALVVGPEGGFSPAEEMQLNALPNISRWKIGTTRLRTETATTVLLGIIAAMRT